jgi:hypothetical protein
MNNTHEVISAFVDDELVEPAQLAEALSDPEGREMLLDLLALRHVMQPPAHVAAPRQHTRSWRWALAAAAVIVALVGGFWLGERRAQLSPAAAPDATRVVEPGEWQPLP